jgi:hypothetical protein
MLESDVPRETVRKLQCRDTGRRALRFQAKHHSLERDVHELLYCVGASAVGEIHLEATSQRDKPLAGHLRIVGQPPEQKLEPSSARRPPRLTFARRHRESPLRKKPAQ